MPVAYIEITAACNFRCSFCPLVRMERPMLTMPREMVIDLIGQIRRDALAETISFHVMGEPTLHKNLAEFCQVSTDEGLKVSLVTNASRLSPEMNKALLDTRINKLSISLRSPDDEYYSEIHKASKKFNYEAYLAQVRSLIAESNARDADYPTSIVVRVFQKSFSDALREKLRYQELLYNTDAMIGRLLEWGRDLCGMGPEELRRRYPDRFAHKSIIPLTPRVSIKTDRLMSWWQQEADLAETKYPAVVSYCAGYKEQFAVLADGRVTSCCLDYEGMNSLGNVKEQPLKAILGGTPVSGFIASFDRYRPPTRTCANCMGGNTLAESIARQAYMVGRHAAGKGLSAFKSRTRSA